mgnify:FL=1
MTPNYNAFEKYKRKSIKSQCSRALLMNVAIGREIHVRIGCGALYVRMILKTPKFAQGKMCIVGRHIERDKSIECEGD